MTDRNPEDDYFAKLDQEKKEKLREKVSKEQEATLLEERRKLHWNRCGKCGAEMATHTFRGVEVEICPDCGAVLLDRGELQTLAGEDQSGVIASIVGMFRSKT